MPVIVESPLGGNLGASTASFFKLDPATFTVPIEPVIDLVPGVTPLRVTLDMIDQEQIEMTFDTTDNALQDFTDVSSNIRHRLETASVTGTISGVAPLTPLGVPPPPTPPGIRLDLIRVANLRALARQGLPILYTSPRFSLARAFITSISQPWSPDNGESTVVTIGLREARLVSPIAVPLAADFPAMVTGNNAATGGGQQTGSVVEPQTLTAPAGANQPPGVKAA